MMMTKKKTISRASKASKARPNAGGTVVSSNPDSQWRRLITDVHLVAVVTDSVSAARTRPAAPDDQLHAVVDADGAMLRRDGNSVEFSFKVQFQGVSGDDLLASAAVELRLTYAFADLASFDAVSLDELLGRFARMNVPYNAWPFAREKLAQLTGWMGLPTFYLPPLLVGPGAKKIPGKGTQRT
ncbi:MAG: hypothetical protein AB7K09_02430 [Planctomycetota bacterium]